MRRSLVAAALLLAGVWITAASTRADVSGTLFDDRDGDGIHDDGEPELESVPVRLFGRTVGGVPVDQTVATGLNGSYLFTPGDGCYLVAPSDPAGWRLTGPREDRFFDTEPGYLAPVGQPRFSKLDQVIANLQSGSFRQSALGDSIAANFNVFCGGLGFWYNQQLRSRLECVSGATIALDEAAVLGETSDDLLLDEPDLNNVFRMIDLQPELVTISMIGNDLLDVDPGDGGTQQDTNIAVAEVLDARQNLQEALSALVSEVPDADIVLNTLYDNEADDCSPTQFHRTWVPIVDRILRDLAWGQARRVTTNEVAAEFAQLDQGGNCTGFPGLICQFFLDLIHPTQVGGYPVIAEKLWEAAGGVRPGTDDVLGRTTFDGVDYGYLRRVRRLLPTAWEIRDGASVVAPQAALEDADGGAAAAISLGNGTEELRLTGFADWYDEIQIVRVVAGVRYRTNGLVDDDLYRMEASVTGAFRPPPGFDYTPTDWNFYTPIVGGGGPSQPATGPDYPSAKTLVVPNVASYRDVSALLSKNPTLPPGADDYVWPPLTHDELATTAIRVAAAPDPGAAGDDVYQVELDYAWLDLYGWERARPAEVTDLRLGKQPDGTLELTFDSLSGAQRYNVYTGRASSVADGTYDHGAGAPAGPWCDVATSPSGGRLTALLDPVEQPPGGAYFLITAHVDDVESPAGKASAGDEIARSRSICR